MFEILKTVGWSAFPIFLCSLISTAVIIDKLVRLRKGKCIPVELADAEILDLLTHKPNLKKALAEHGQTPLGQLLAEIAKDPRKANPARLEKTGKVAVSNMERGLTALAVVATISPLLGLFGTILGMIEIFASQSSSGADVAQLAHGVSLALYNTAFGMAVAIPSLAALRSFRSQVQRISISLELICHNWLEQLEQGPKS